VEGHNISLPAQGIVLTGYPAGRKDHAGIGVHITLYSSTGNIAMVSDYHAAVSTCGGPPAGLSCMLTVECLRFRDYGIIPGPMLRDTTRTPADEPQDTASYTRKLIMFPCSGVKCQAWLYLPKGAEEKPPIVVAAHGVGQWGAGPDQFLICSWLQRRAAQLVAQHLVQLPLVSCRRWCALNVHQQIVAMSRFTQEINYTTMALRSCLPVALGMLDHN